MHRRTALITLSLVTGCAAGAVLAITLRALAHTPHTQPAAAAVAFQPRPAPDFTLTDQSGAPVTLSAQRGHWVLLTFMDPQCRTLCPVMGRDVGALERALPPSIRPMLLIVSVAPGRTPHDVHRFLAAEKPGWMTGWHWLLGPSAPALKSTWLRWDIAVLPTAGDVTHDSVLELIDPTGHLRVTYPAPLVVSEVSRTIESLAHSSN